MADSRFHSINGDEITGKERKAIQALAGVAKLWPPTLTLLSMDGVLHVIHTGDPRIVAEGRQDRYEAVLYEFEGIPNDGGGW